MNNIVIQTTTNSVYYNGNGATNLKLTIPSTVKVLYFDSINNVGWIENLNVDGDYIGNTEITSLPDWANVCITVYQQSLPPEPISPTPIEMCKSKAKSFLKETDWVEIPSVTNVSNMPHLLNAVDFMAYRTAVRALAVNPVDNPIWPTLPTEQWSS
jgi:hypothetical protein